MKSTLIKLHTGCCLLSLALTSCGYGDRCGFCPPTYIRDLGHFRSSYAGKLSFMPCFHNRFEEGGTTKSEYFWQDLWVARQIQAAIVYTTAQPSHDWAAAFAPFQVWEDQL